MMVTTSRDGQGKLHNFTIDVMITNSEDVFHLEQKYILPEKADFSLRPNHIMVCEKKLPCRDKADLGNDWEKSDC
jgi:hypothetical protein